MSEKIVQEKTKVIHRMGTTITLQVAHRDPEWVLSELERLLAEYEKRFSANDSSSELMAINQAAGQEPVVVHPELFELIKIGKFHSCQPDSQLNIAIGPLVQSWRIGFKEATVLTPEEVANLLPLTDPQQIVLDEDKQSVLLAKPGMLLDLGSLAKGYIADKLRRFCAQNQTSYALINLGGNIVTYGTAPKNQDGYWRIGIRDPKGTREQSLEVIKIRDASLVTSGIYERYLKQGTTIYHHIIDPETGFPSKSDLASLTIVSRSSLVGEIWTTRLFGKSISQILTCLEKQSEVEGILVTNDNHIIQTSGIKDNYFRKEEPQ
jgi:thiamine biosynthesis lipoprotein